MNFSFIWNKHLQSLNCVLNMTQYCFPIPNFEKKKHSEIFNEYSRSYVHDTQSAIKTFKKIHFFKLIFKKFNFSKYTTFTTIIWFLPILYPWMLCNDIFLWDGLFTITALVWLILKLIIKLFYKYLGMWEKFITTDALIWFLPTMRLLLYYKMIILGENPF